MRHTRLATRDKRLGRTALLVISSGRVLLLGYHAQVRLGVAHWRTICWGNGFACAGITGTPKRTWVWHRDRWPLLEQFLKPLDLASLPVEDP